MNELKKLIKIEETITELKSKALRKINNYFVVRINNADFVMDFKEQKYFLTKLGNDIFFEKIIIDYKTSEKDLKKLMKEIIINNVYHSIKQIGIQGECYLLFELTDIKTDFPKEFFVFSSRYLNTIKEEVLKELEEQ